MISLWLFKIYFLLKYSWITTLCSLWFFDVLFWWLLCSIPLLKWLIEKHFMSDQIFILISRSWQPNLDISSLKYESLLLYIPVICWCVTNYPKISCLKSVAVVYSGAGLCRGGSSLLHIVQAVVAQLGAAGSIFKMAPTLDAIWCWLSAGSSDRAVEWGVSVLHLGLSRGLVAEFQV